jgi:hypothetical protein
MERVQFIQTALPRLLGIGGRRGYVLDFIILIGWKILIRRFTEEGMPVRAVEVGELGWIGHNCSKPIIERYMKLWSDGPRLEVQHQRDHTRVPIAHSHVHVVLRARLPARDLLASRESVIEDVNRTAPHVKITELCLQPAHAGEDVDRRLTVLLRGHSVPDVDRMAYGHRPQL